MKTLIHSPWRLVIGLLVADFIFFTTTHPSKVGVLFLIVGFMLVVATLYVVTSRLLDVFKLYGIHFGKHQRRIAMFVTVIIGGLLALQSMGELGVRDAVVAVPLALVLYLYLSYGRPKPATERVT